MPRNTAERPLKSLEEVKSRIILCVAASAAEPKKHSAT
jgi:hypothetical protein